MMFKLTNIEKSIEMRSVYGQTLLSLFDQSERLVALDADLASSSGAHELFSKYPQRAIDVGISEQNMIGVAAGMSVVGLRPYVHTFAPFCTRRVLDQIYTSVAYSQNDIHIYGSDPGYWSLYNGATHTTFEDIAIIKAIPQMTVFAPSDPTSFAWILKYYAEHGGSIYTRAPRKPLPLIYTEKTDFIFGKASVIKDGDFLALISIGDMLTEAKKVAEMLEQDGISVMLVDLLFAKPYDRVLIRNIIKQFKYIVSMENHYVVGGIGDIIAAEIATSADHPFLRKIGVSDRFGEVGDERYLLKTLCLDKDSVYQVIKADLKKGLAG